MNKKVTQADSESQSSFERDLACLNEFYFFREFTFSRTTFRPTPQDELELADNVVWLRQTLFVYQLKERVSAGKTPADEQRWFESKVLGQATKQIRDTLSYLENNAEICVENHRGHKFGLRFDTIREIHKIVLHRPSQNLPGDCRGVKCYTSSTAGVIHVFAEEDYRGLVRTLLTPAEVADYLGFRRKLIQIWGMELDRLPEQALVGQYLSGCLDDQPNLKFVGNLVALNHNTEEWDMSGVIGRFADRIGSKGNWSDYYPIVREIALLKRNELREVKQRLRYSMENAKIDGYVKPYRVAFPRTGCGFVFIPVTSEFLPHRQQGLENLTAAHKYEQRLEKCVGVLIAFEGNGWFSEEWCYLEFPWERDQALETILRENNPFRDVTASELPRYEFKQPMR